MERDDASVEIELKRVLEELHGYNNIQYAAYRSASKLCVLQKALQFDSVPVKLIRGVLERHQIFTTDNALNLELHELEPILYDVYFVISKENSRNNLNVNFYALLMLKLLCTVYAKGRGETVSVLDIKVGLVTLSGSPLQTKYQYWFSELADHNMCLPRRRLQCLLESLLAITELIFESNTFSTTLIQPTLDSCYIQNCSLGITEGYFMSWILREPQLLVWLSTFYRLCAANKVIHQVRCAVCHTYPIVGLRYHCLCCICYDMCQHCFFTARTSKRHKTSHVIREYCTQISSYETTISFLKGLLNKLCGGSARLQYLPAPSYNSQAKMYSENNSVKPNRFEDKALLMSNEGLSCTVRGTGCREQKYKSQMNPVRQLEDIIYQIESETRSLKQAIGKASPNSLINQHAYFLNEQLERLRALQMEQCTTSRARCMSTPLTHYNQTCKDLELSSILVQPDDSWQSPNPSGFSTWLKNDAQEETSNTQQMQADLDHILKKLQHILETNFSVLNEN